MNQMSSAQLFGCSTVPYFEITFAGNDDVIPVDCVRIECKEM